MKDFKLKDLILQLSYTPYSDSFIQANVSFNPEHCNNVVSEINALLKIPDVDVHISSTNTICDGIQLDTKILEEKIIKKSIINLFISSPENDRKLWCEVLKQVRKIFKYKRR